MEITFTLRKNGDYMSSSLGSRSFPVDRQAGKQKFCCLKSCNLNSNRLLTFLTCSNRSVPDL